MSPNNLHPKQPNNKDDQEPQNNSTSNNNNRKSSTARPQEQNLKCPRCDSPNTKFCYYNNYSLTQPRHFCKTCRRYWTKGGALRNVPIGGGCRKNKKMKSSSSRLSTDSKDSSGSSEIGGFKFFHGLSPAMDFNLGGLSSSFPRPNTSLFTQFSSFGETSAAHTVSVATPSCFSLEHHNHPSAQTSSTSFLGFNYPLSGFNGAIQDMPNSSMNVHTTIASSIESLSSINQDLHWKLQQQRLAMLFGGESQKDGSVSNSVHVESPQKPQPILFQNLEISKPEASCGVGNSRKDGGNTATEWFFGNSYGQMTTTPATSNGNGGNHESGSNWNGVQAWSDLHQYSGLP